MDSTAVQHWLGNILEANTLSFNTTASTVSVDTGKTTLLLYYCLFQSSASFINPDARG